MIFRVKSGSCFWDYDSIDAALEHLEDAFRYWDDNPSLKELMPELDYNIRKAYPNEIVDEISNLYLAIKIKEESLKRAKDPHWTNACETMIQKYHDKIAWYKANRVESEK